MLDDTWTTNPTAVAELESRARWGGLLAGIAPLSLAEWRAWRRYRESLPTWCPMRALRYAWCYIDSYHGSGPWDPHAFAAVLAEDKAAIDAVCHDHPEQRARLTIWLEETELLGAERAADPCAGAAYIPRLLMLGYDSINAREQDHNDDD